MHLVIHQAIHILHLVQNLLCPMQCCVAGVIMNDLPKYLVTNPTNDTHVLLCMPQDDEDHSPSSPSQTVNLPLNMKGVISSLNMSKPKADKWTKVECTCIKLTSEHQLWDPYNPTFESQELPHSRGRSLVIQ